MQEATSNEIVGKLFEYDDYRVFLKDFFNARKKEDTSFSHRSFAKQVGFKSHSFCTLVIEGKRNLSEGSIRKIAKGIKLRGKALSFFTNLVYLNQTETLPGKDYFLRKVRRIGKKTDFYQLNQNQFFYYEKWYYPVIRELMVLSDWNGDYTRLAKLVRPSITPLEAKLAAELLLASGMVKLENGRYLLSDEFVTSERVPVYIKKKARRDVLLKGVETIENSDPSDKYFAYATVTMSRKLYEEARTILDRVRMELLSLVARDGDPDEVYEMVFQLFPLSNMKGETRGLEGDGNAA